MKNKKCKHRLGEDMCLASCYQPYDLIYECKHAKKECPYYEAVKEN